MKLEERHKIPIDITVRIDGLELAGGSNTSSMLTGVHNNVVLVFEVTSRVAGIYRLGPVMIGAKDRMGVLVKEMYLPTNTYVVFLEELRRIPPTTTGYVSAGFSDPGLSRHPYTGLEDDYRMSLPSAFTPTAKLIDWKRLAKTGGDEIYVKELDRRRSANMIYGLGSGFDIYIPGRGSLHGLVINLILQSILEQIKEGSQTWLFQQTSDAKFFFARVTYDEAGLRFEGAETLPKYGRIFYLSRMVVDDEIDDVSELMSKVRGDAIILLLNISTEVGRILPYHVTERVSGEEERRLVDLSARLNVRCCLAALDSLPEALRRAISSGHNVLQ
ncbi:hypothetical protein KEJ23_03385 [Candidatus Bathyarchaeota archaeon]|nr:hypothetical protein [Candidatus Bathyarchaeota archaeon]